jgi:hypothetical protein
VAHTNIQNTTGSRPREPARHGEGSAGTGITTLLNVLERQLLSSEPQTCPCYSPPSRTTSSRLLRKMALSGWSVPRVAWIDFSEAKREGGHPRGGRPLLVACRLVDSQWPLFSVP